MSTRRLFESLFVVALFAMAVRETLDPDMWWHLRTGEYILEHGIPRQDIFSYTVTDHIWVTHEWLSQVFMWIVFQMGGFPALILVFGAIITATFFLTYLASEGRPYIAAFVVLLAAIASAITWGARPQMFNLLFTALFVFIIERVRSRQASRRWLWLLPVLTVIWVNLHSGYLLGVVLLAVYFAGDLLESWFVRRRVGAQPQTTLGREGLRLLGVVTLLSFLAALLNPNGYTIWYYPFETLGSSAMQAYIQEWHPPDFHFSLFWPFGAMLLLGLVSWLVAFRAAAYAPTATDVLLFVGTAAAGLLSARHIPLFAIIATPPIARAVWAIVAQTSLGPRLIGSTRAPKGFLPVLNLLIFVGMAIVALLWASTKILNNEAAIAERYPVAAITWLEESGRAQEAIYNSYGWGGYLTWRGIPVFVDGRADVYGDPFLFYYLQTLELRQNWREPLDDYNVRYVLMERGSSLGTLLLASGEWEEAYVDEVAEIFARLVE